MPFHATSLFEGLNDELGTDVNVLYSRGIEDLRRIADAMDFSTAASGGQRGLQAEAFDNLDLAGVPVRWRL